MSRYPRKKPTKREAAATLRLFAPLSNQAALAQQQAAEQAELGRRQVDGEAARMIVEELSPSHDRAPRH